MFMMCTSANISSRLNSSRELIVIHVHLSTILVSYTLFGRPQGIKSSYSMCLKKVYCCILTDLTPLSRTENHRVDLELEPSTQSIPLPF